MKVNGREIKFLRTVSATCDIADMCKDGDIKNADTLFDGKYQISQKTAAKFIAVLNKGYEDNKAFSDKGYEPNPISAEELLTLPEDIFNELFVESISAYTGDKPTVETEVVKEGKKKGPRK